MADNTLTALADGLDISEQIANVEQVEDFVTQRLRSTWAARLRVRIEVVRLIRHHIRRDEIRRRRAERERQSEFRRLLKVADR